MSEQEQRTMIGGDYWDDHGIWQLDSSGNMYWTRASQGDGYYYGDSGYPDNSGYPSLTDGIDYNNTNHFTFNTSGNTVFQNHNHGVIDAALEEYRRDHGY